MRISKNAGSPWDAMGFHWLSHGHPCRLDWGPIPSRKFMQIWHGPVGPVLTNPLLTGNFATASHRWRWWRGWSVWHRKKDGFNGKFMEFHGVFMGFSSDLMVRDICLIGFSNGIWMGNWWSIHDIMTWPFLWDEIHPFLHADAPRLESAPLDPRREPSTPSSTSGSSQLWLSASKKF
jgi:hypothetical protein